MRYPYIRSFIVFTYETKYQGKENVYKVKYLPYADLQGAILQANKIGIELLNEYDILYIDPKKFKNVHTLKKGMEITDKQNIRYKIYEVSQKNIFIDRIIERELIESPENIIQKYGQLICKS